MPKVTEAALKKQIKDGRFERVYLLYGEESYLVNYYRNQLKNAVVGQRDNSFNLQVFRGDDLKLDALCESLEALPMFCEKKCVEIVDINLEKLDDKGYALLKAAMKDLPQSTVLIISQMDSSFSGKKPAKNAGFIKLAEEVGASLECKRLGPLALQKQLISWAKSLGTVMGQNSAAVMIEKCGNRLFVLKNELCKVCAFCGYSTVDEHMVKRVVASVQLETTVFAITKAMSVQNYYEAYRQLDLLFAQKHEPVAILAVLASFYVDLYRVKVAVEEGKDPLDLAEIFDYKKKAFRLSQAKSECERLSKSQLSNCLDIITNADYSMKSSRVDAKLLLQEAIAKIAIC